MPFHTYLVFIHIVRRLRTVVLAADNLYHKTYQDAASSILKNLITWSTSSHEPRIADILWHPKFESLMQEEFIKIQINSIYFNDSIFEIHAYCYANNRNDEEPQSQMPIIYSH